jgi:hypothetical protein
MFVLISNRMNKRNRTGEVDRYRIKDKRGVCYLMVKTVFHIRSEKTFPYFELVHSLYKVRGRACKLN